MVTVRFLRVAAVVLLRAALALRVNPSLAPAKSLRATALRKGAAAAFAAAIAVGVPLGPARAFGPESIALDGVSYADTGKKPGDICAGRPLKAPGEKVAAGLLPKCVLVKGTAVTKMKEAAKDAAVYGYVKTATGDSAIANNPDFRSDAGQFAMIKLVPAKGGEVEFEFVAVIPDSIEELGELSFTGLKAVAYPGGARMATFTACELDSLSDACDEEQEKFISK